MPHSGIFPISSPLDTQAFQKYIVKSGIGFAMWPTSKLSRDFNPQKNLWTHNLCVQNSSRSSQVSVGPTTSCPSSLWPSQSQDSQKRFRRLSSPRVEWITKGDVNASKVTGHKMAIPVYWNFPLTPLTQFFKMLFRVFQFSCLNRPYE